MLLRFIEVVVAVVLSQHAEVSLAPERVGPPPHALTFASQYGTHVLDVRVTYQEAQMVSVTGKLFMYDKAGLSKVLWEKELSYLPQRVLVSDFGPIVTLNTWGRAGSKHALVVYDEQARVMADYDLGDLLNAEERKKHERLWDFYSAIKFTRETFCMKLLWGKEIRVDLATGKLLRE